MKHYQKHHEASWNLTFLIGALLLSVMCLGIIVSSWLGSNYGDSASFWLRLSALSLGLGGALYYSWTHRQR